MVLDGSRGGISWTRNVNKGPKLKVLPTVLLGADEATGTAASSCLSVVLPGYREVSSLDLTPVPSITSRFTIGPASMVLIGRNPGCCEPQET